MDKEAELIRKERFPDRFPRIASTPLINRAVGAVYFHGIPYVLFLLVAILVFTETLWNSSGATPSTGT